MIWLGIDTSNTPLSVALVEEGRVLIEHTDSFKTTHSVAAMPAIDLIMKEAGITPDQLDAIAVAKGPGSYTGIRIGMTLAKTLAWSLSIPVYPVSSLAVLAAPGKWFEGVTVSVMDARRNHLFVGVYEKQMVLLEAHIHFDELLTFLREKKQPVLWCGQDVATFREQILAAELVSHFAGVGELLPRASELIALAQNSEPALEIHALTPDYLRLTEAEVNWMKANE
ncbi:tRNA (adenosine(37)-N6)-threonylcarbamoyltransferase complex dimerization subunit type 1 TsaB [Chryseomicrobium sp. FSL W7-1435]|uniref:tRNA (adenosine(37)-N6)-threonylcarbamoyltransferase complex dimerization subunit type 1 TsaB n=1 Tax=Chryseomicrobium sp. FSL W7-1435 TaxID=2921704 RepID=UPI0031599C64